MSVGTKIIQSTRGGARSIARTGLVLAVALTTCLIGAGGAQAASVVPASAPVVVMAAPQAAVVAVAPSSLASLGGGTCGIGACIYLDRGNQVHLKQGGIAALNFALCLIPVIGWVGCGAITAGLHVASNYLAQHPFCDTDLEIKVAGFGVGATRCT